MKIVLTGWKGGTFGFRVSVKDRKLFRGMTKVKLELPNPYGESCQIEIKLSPSFWRSCPELRSRKIGEWMHNRGDCLQDKRHLWPKGKGRPPKYEAKITGDHLRVIA